MILVLLACETADESLVHFDGPVAAAVLAPEDGPFDEPVGVVANARSGLLTLLDLKEGRLLTDDVATSFLRAQALPTGRARVISDVALVGDGTRVNAWVIDAANAQALLVPWIVGQDGLEPIERAPHLGPVTFVDADSSGDAATMPDVLVRQGWTTTEDWTLTFDGTVWIATGTRSGEQRAQATTGEVYKSDYGELELTIEGAATAGDHFTFSTDSGVVEVSPGGPPTALLAGEGLVYVSVADAEAPRVELYDAFTALPLGRVALGAGSQPGRLAWGPEGTLFVADTARPVVHQLVLQGTTAAVSELPAAAEVVDVAWQSGQLADGTPYSRLYTVPLGLNRVDVYDLDAGGWFDANPLTPEAEGISLGTPIGALAASVGEVATQSYTSWGAQERSAAIVVATALGPVYLLDAATGCFFTDYRGAHGPNDILDGAALVTLSDQGASSDVDLLYDATTGEQVQASACGGVTRNESWIVTYHSATLDWEVEGGLSGVQVGRARSDQRYVSDDGSVSFTLVSGARPPTDGDYFTFVMADGLLEFTQGDVTGDGIPEGPWTIAGRPATYTTRNGPTGGGWDGVDERQYAVLPVMNSDLAARLFLDAGYSELGWL